jgi:N-acylneuraminate cytidylyltransferase
MNIICIIPARGGSKGIPRKNLVEFCGKPLIQWSIEQAKGSNYIDHVYVSSDDEEILKVSQSTGAYIVRRPKYLATDTTSSDEAILHALKSIQEHRQKNIDIVVFLQATSPVRISADIDKAVELFISQEADSLFSGSLLDDFCIWEIDKDQLRSITFDYKDRGTRQKRRPCYLENGSLYIFKPEILKQFHNRLGGKIIFYPMPMWKSYEIDVPEDVEICEYYMNKKILKKQGA